MKLLSMITVIATTGLFSFQAMDRASITVRLLSLKYLKAM